MPEITSGTAELFRERRREIGLGYKEVALRAGYRNIDKGMRRMEELEDGTNYFPHPEIRKRFAEVLDISEDAIESAMKENFRELDRPVEPQIIIRVMAAVYREPNLPPGCTREEAERIAERLSWEEGERCCVVLSHVRSLFYEPDGTKEEIYTVPAGGIFSGGDDLEFVRSMKRYRNEERAETSGVK